VRNRILTFEDSVRNRILRHYEHVNMWNLTSENTLRPQQDKCHNLRAVLFRKSTTALECVSKPPSTALNTKAPAIVYPTTRPIMPTLLNIKATNSRK
jgi:hypothetical protein